MNIPLPLIRRAVITLSVFTSSYCTHKTIVDPQAQNLYDFTHMCSLMAPPSCFVVLNREGNNLVGNDSADLRLTYSYNGVESTVRTNTFSLRQAVDDYQLSSAYGGIGWNTAVSQLSNQPVLPLDTFRLYVHQKLVGYLYYHQRRLTYDQGCFTNASMGFNGLPLKVDTTVAPYVGVIQL